MSHTTEVVITINDKEFIGDLTFSYTPYEAPTRDCPGCAEDFELEKLMIEDIDCSWMLEDISEELIEQIKAEEL